MKFTKKKSLVLVVAMICIIGLLAGCSAAGNGYMNLVKEVNSLEQYAFDGTMTLGLDMSDLLGDVELGAEAQEALDSLENIQITYDGEYIASSDTYHMNISMALGNQNMPMEIYMQGGEILISSESMLQSLAVFGATEADIAANREALQGVNWLDMNSVSSILRATIGGLDISKLVQGVYDALDVFNAGSFSEYDPQIFSTRGNGYVLNIPADQLSNVATGFSTYFIDHYAAILTDCETILSGVDDSVLTPFGTTKAEALSRIRDDLRTVTITDEDKASINQTIAQICAMFNGTSINSYIAPNGTGKYTETQNLNLVISGYLVGIDSNFTVKMDSTMNIDSTANINMAYPTTGVKTIAEIAEGMKANAVTGIFYMDDQEIFWSKYYDASLITNSGVTAVTPIIRDDYNYFPIRQIGELFDEQVEWDTTTRKAYVVQGDTRIEMTGVVENQRTYIKLRDFEKLGYVIDYEVDELLGPIATFSKTVEEAPAA